MPAIRWTASREVPVTISSSTTGAHSRDSTGRTWRNQPVAPAMVNSAPSTLTEAAVTMPANTRVKPKAKTIGQAVGAGTSILSGAFIVSPLNSDHVNHQEDHDPNRIDEMPIQRENLQPFGVLSPEQPRKIEEHDGRKGEKSHRDVKSMQANQRVIRCTEQIRVYREAITEDQMNPFASGPKEEDSPEQNSKRPVTRKCGHVSGD